MKTIAHLLSLCLIFCLSPLFEICAKVPLHSGLPVPRFAALRSNDVNLRTGPGTRYPISWILKKKFLPVKVIMEHENWRKIQLQDGTIGWVFQSMLTGNKMITMHNEKTLLRKSPNNQSAILASVGKNVICELKLCKDAWCRITLNQHSGGVERSQIWGAEFDKK